MRREYLFVACGVLVVGALIPSQIVVAQQNPDSFDPFHGLDQFGTAEPGPRSPQGKNNRLNDAIPLPAELAITTANSEVHCHCVGEDASAPTVARIRDALRAPLKKPGLDYVEQPLEEVVNLLQEEYGIPVMLDIVALDDFGIQKDKPVTVTLRGISLGAAMRLFLNPLGLTYAVHDEVVLITTPDAEEKRLQICVYDIRDLLPAGRQGQDFDTLIDAIVSCVANETWAENGGGVAQIRPMPPGFLIISQTAAVHDEIRGLLDTIRRMKSRPTPTAIDTGSRRPADAHHELHRESYGRSFTGRPSEANQAEKNARTR